MTKRALQRVLLTSVCLLYTAGINAQIRSVTTPASSNGSRVSSAAVEADGYIYVSAQGPRRADGSLPEGFTAQARQALENVKSVVTAAGLTMKNVVYCQVYLEDITKSREVDSAFAEIFGKTLPARAVLGVANLPEPGIQINAVAVRDLKDKKEIFPASFKSTEAASPGVLTHDRLFISAMTGSDADGKVPADPGAQVDLALDRMKAVVEASGLDMKNVVFVNPYLTSDIPMKVMNERYAKRFEFGNTPARATIEVSSLPGNIHIEYTGVAVRDLKQRRSIRPKNMPPSPTASPCVFAGDTLYCSAKSGFIPGAHGGVYAMTTPHQLRQTMRNLLDNLEEADMKFDQVVSTTVYLDNLDDTKEFDDVFQQYFGEIMPARTTIQQIAPAERATDKDGHYPDLEQVSLIAVRSSSNH